jgi:two-component system NtrC family sensor kinase
MSRDIIVKQHGGSEVATEPGLFTEFRIVLPRKSQR